MSFFKKENKLLILEAKHERDRLWRILGSFLWQHENTKGNWWCLSLNTQGEKDLVVMHKETYEKMHQIV